MTACPYGAVHYYIETKTYFPEGPTPYERIAYAKLRKGTALKCTFCEHKIKNGRYVEDPACVLTCPTEARIFGDLDDPNSKVSKLRAIARPLKSEAGTSPSVLYIY